MVVPVGDGCSPGAGCCIPVGDGCSPGAGCCIPVGDGCSPGAGWLYLSEMVVLLVQDG